VTYDPGHRGGGRVPVLRNDVREPLRAQRDPLAGDSGRPRSNRDQRRQWRKQTWLGRFVSTYGWRAYALPVLMVLTCVVLYQTVTGTVAPAAETQDAVEGPALGPRHRLLTACTQPSSRRWPSAGSPGDADPSPTMSCAVSASRSIVDLMSARACASL